MKRQGFTIAELLVATALAGLVAGSMAITLSRQQRFYASASAVLDVRGQLRDAADVLTSDIRGAAVSTFGIPLMTDSAVELFTVIGTSVACGSPTGTAIGLPPNTLVRGNTLTSILAQPDTGDLAMLYGVPAGFSDSARWETVRVASFSSRALSASCPPSTGFTMAGDAAAGSTGYVVSLAASPSPAVGKGALIVFVRRARYSLYRSSDGEWYLGYRRCNATLPGCSAIQPVSGPYRPYSASPGAAGLSFLYYDSTGVELSAPSRAVARIDIVLRGQTAQPASLSGDSRAAYRDSVVVSVSPRNRL